MIARRRQQPEAGGTWAPVRVQVGDGTEVYDIGEVYLDGQHNVAAVAEFFRGLADQLDPPALYDDPPSAS